MKKKELINLSKDEYTALLAMGVLFELYPEATGTYEEDMSEKKKSWLTEQFEFAERSFEILDAKFHSVPIIRKRIYEEVIHYLRNKVSEKYNENTVVSLLESEPDVKRSEEEIRFLEFLIDDLAKKMEPPIYVYCVHKQYGIIKRIPIFAAKFVNKDEWIVLDYFPSEEVYYKHIDDKVNDSQYHVENKIETEEQKRRALTKYIIKNTKAF